MIGLLFDNETTGLLNHPEAQVQPKVIEFGCVAVDCKTGETLLKKNFIINPEEPIEEVITKITGLTDEDLSDKPTFTEVWPEIKQLIEGADVVIAHNLPFDYGVVEAEVARHGLELEWPQMKICTVQEYLPIYGYRPKLTQLYEDVMGEKLEQTHRASDDCEAMLEVVLKEKLLERLYTASAGAN